MSDQDKQSFSTNKQSFSTNRNNHFSSLVLGVVIGATITYLFTNKKGQKIKDHLLKEGKKLLEGISDIAADLEENVNKKLEEGKEEVEEKVEEAPEVPQHIEQIQKKGRRFFFRRSDPNPES